MKFRNTELQIVKDSIATLSVDAIVNAAYKSFSGSGSVDGAIHAAAGPELFKACLRLGGCKLGEAKITYGYNLPAKFVIHTAGPVHGREDGFEASYLEDCYKHSLLLADEKGLESLAFSSISTGVYGYPVLEAAPIALETTREFLEAHPKTCLKKIVFVCLSGEILEAYREILPEVFA